MVHAAKADMATAHGKTRVADTVDREVMAAATKVPVAAAATMPIPMPAAMPGIGRVVGAGKHQRGRHQDGCSEQLFQHRWSPPVLRRWQSRCRFASGKPRNVAPAREAVAFRRLAWTFAAFGILLLSSTMLARAEGRGEGDLIAGLAHAVDAGTFDLATYRMRVWGIDAPERESWCFRNGEKWRPAAAATQALGACLIGRTITCRIHRLERHWFAVRYVAECWSEDGRDIGDCMVEGGWATDYTCYSDGYYKDRETEAKNKGFGLWGCDNGPPTRRWGRKGQGALCETPAYKPTGPAPR